MMAERCWELMTMPGLIPIESQNNKETLQIEMPVDPSAPTAAHGLVLKLKIGKNHKCSSRSCPQPFRCHLCDKCYSTRGKNQFLMHQNVNLINELLIGRSIDDSFAPPFE